MKLRCLISLALLLASAAARASNYTAALTEPCVLLTWNAPTGSDPAASYNLYRSATSGGPYSSIATAILTTSYLDCSVTAANIYYYVVTAVDSSANESSYSNQAALEVPFYDSFSAYGATSVNPGDTIPTSTASSSQAHFLIAKSESISTTAEISTDFSGPDPITENYDEDLSGSFSGTISGHATYQIASADTFVFSDSLAFGSIIAPPVWLSVVSSVFPAQVQLGWRHSPSAGITSQNVRRAQSIDGPYNVIATLAPAVQYYTDSSVFPGFEYFYAVTAVGASGESMLSNEAATIVPFGVAPPAALFVTVRNGAPVLVWRHSPTRGLTSENIYRGTQQGGPYAPIASLSTIAQNYTDRTALSGVTYFYVVTDVVAGAGESGFSNEVTLKVP